MKFRKRPVVVEAEQFFPYVRPWPAGVIANPKPWGLWDSYSIKTLEGSYAVTPGDWIITGVKGEKYPCKPDVFEASYDKVAELTPCPTCPHWKELHNPDGSCGCGMLCEERV